MTTDDLAKKIREAEASGLRLVGFWAAPDVYDKCVAAFPETPSDGPGRLLAHCPLGVWVRRSSIVPSGHIAPVFER